MTSAGGGWLTGVELERLSDEAYFLRMRACGSQSRLVDDRYIGLLVGAEDRGLPRLRGFRDIFHMAALQARMPRKKVREVLRIARAIRACPGLWRLFTRAEVSWTKIRAIATVARPEWDVELCSLVRTRTRKDIELWLRERARQLAAAVPYAVSSSHPRPTGSQLTEGAGPEGNPFRHADAAGPDPLHAGETRNGQLRAGFDPDSPFATVTGASGVPPPASGDVGRPDSGSGKEQSEGWSPASGVPPFAGAPAWSGASGSRAADADTVAATLAWLGVDPLAVEKLLIDREALGVTHGSRKSLAWVLEQAIHAYRPSARPVKLPHVPVMLRCPGCRKSFVEGRSGPLPVDDDDAVNLRKSGAATDLDAELAVRGIADPETSAWPQVPGGDTSLPGQDRAEPARADAESVAATRGPRPARTSGGRPRVPAKEVRLLMALQRGRCAFPRCPEPPSEIHHRDPYDPVQGHELSNMHLVCRDHHRLAHTGGIENPADHPTRWHIRMAPVSSSCGGGRREAVDRSYRERLHGAARRDRELAQEFAAEDDLPFDELKHGKG